MAQSDKIQIRFWVETGFAGARHEETQEWDRDEWESMTQDQRYEAAQDFLNNCGVEAGFDVED